MAIQLGPHLPQSNRQNIEIKTQNIHQQLTTEVRLLARKEKFMSIVLPLDIFFNVFTTGKLVPIPEFFHCYPLEISNFKAKIQTKLNSI